MKELAPAEAKQWMDAHPDGIVVDCRESDELKSCSIQDAVNVPLSVFGYVAPDKLPDKARPILIYCHHGMRSQTAAQFLEKRGYSDVSSLQGGIDQWSCQVDPSVPRY